MPKGSQDDVILSEAKNLYSSLKLQESIFT
jgi:hypothetical protein